MCTLLDRFNMCQNSMVTKKGHQNKIKDTSGNLFNS